MSAKKIPLRIGSVKKAVLVAGQTYQDPRDALNEFVSNAADEYAESERKGERIRIVMRRRGKYPTIVVDDSGRGMSPERLEEVARNLFNSAKAGDDRTLGEKAIGMLAFQQLGAKLDIVSREEGSNETYVLKLTRGEANAIIDREKRRARDRPGTSVYVGHLDKEVLRMVTQRKIVAYLRHRRASALAAGMYEIEVVEGAKRELVTPEEPEGVKVPLRAHETLWGLLEFAVYVAPPGANRSVAIVGRAGTTIIDDITAMDEFEHQPWIGDQVSGRIQFPALQQSAGRRAILRDDDAWPIFVEVVKLAEPLILAMAERVRAELDRDTADRMGDAIRKIFSRVLKELDDLDNPMRTPMGDEAGDGGLLSGLEPSGGPSSDDENDGAEAGGEAEQSPSIDELAPEPGPDEPPPIADGAKPSARRSKRLPSVAVDPSPGRGRSRFDAEASVVLYNQDHPDYLMLKNDESGMLDYLATLVAKEYVVYNNPMAAPDELAEEMVRMVVRVRRHMR
jgi:anti-sigma regulatory factor (Ser/Thr protein kinase)